MKCEPSQNLAQLLSFSAYKDSSGCCGTVRLRSADRPVRSADAEGMQDGIAMERVTNDDRIDSAVSRRCGNGQPAARILTSRTSATRLHWNSSVSGMLAGVLEASGTVQVAVRRKPSDGSRLHEHLAPRALRSGRTSRIPVVVPSKYGPVNRVPKECSGHALNKVVLPNSTDLPSRTYMADMLNWPREGLQRVYDRFMHGFIIANQRTVSVFIPLLSIGKRVTKSLTKPANLAMIHTRTTHHLRDS